MQLLRYTKFTPLALSLFIALLLSSLDADRAGASTFAQTDNVSVELISEVEAAVPGKAFRIGIRQIIKEGWHTYWINPGDSGAPTKLTWDLPAGVSVGPIQWPLPKAIPYFDLMNHGYEGDVFLMSELRLPGDWPEGNPLHIDVTVDWLVCADICIPENVSLSLSLPTTTGPALPHPINGFLFEEAEKHLPRPSLWPSNFEARGDRLKLSLDGNFEQSRIEKAHFFALKPGFIKHASPQSLEIVDNTLTLEMQVDETTSPFESLPGLLVITETTGDGAITQGFELTALPTAAPMESASLNLANPTKSDLALWQAAFFAVLGGLILNLMPCVFPVLSMKALSLVRHAGEPGIKLQGVMYTAGVLISFLSLAGVLIAMKASGAAIGWGFQLQSPLVIALLAYLMLGVGLWLTGAIVLEGGAAERLQSALMNVGGGLAGRTGAMGSFFTGVLAVIVATPCTAPFMAPALGFALTQNATTALIVFVCLGAGFALPFLLLSLSPDLQKILPRPGAWMTRLKEFLAFPMYATAAWLVWVLSQQVGANALLAVLMGFVFLGLTIWLLRFSSIFPRLLCGLSLAATIALAIIPATKTLKATADQDGMSALIDPDGPAIAFSQNRFDSLLTQGKPILINMTASWCITCLVNEETALSSKAFSQALTAKNITYLKGDWTNGDKDITAFLARFERSGVPIYVLYPGNNKEPILLPQILTESIILNALNQVGS